MKTFIFFILLFSTNCVLPAQGIQFEFEGDVPLQSQNIFISGQSVYFTFSSDSQFIYSTYLARWDTKNEKIEWCKKISVERGVSVLPVKILGREDGTFVLGAVDYSWIDGFMNGNYLFIQFDEEGTILRQKRLGSPFGGILRDMIMDGDDILFLGDRINQQSAYRTVLGRLDKDMNIKGIRSVAKDFYTYPAALAKDSKGFIYTAGYTSTDFGLRRALLSKWSPNLDHIHSLMESDDDSNTDFQHIFIDDEDEVHLGGTLGNLATYVHVDENMKFMYGHEFNSGYPLNLWKDSVGHINMLIDGPDYIVRLDDNYNVTYDAQYFSTGTMTGHVFDQKHNLMYSFSSYRNESNPKNKLVLNRHLYHLDKTCFLNNRGGDFNGVLRKDSFSLTNVVVQSETLTETVPTDVIILPYSLSATETCRVGDISGSNDTATLPFSLYPNPASDQLFFITEEDTGLYSGEIIGMDGRIITIPAEEIRQKNISVAGLPTGMYTMRLFNAEGRVLVAKISVLH
jgi:hypothetical protein